MVYISFMAIIAKKIPKHFFNILTSIFIDIFAPTIAPKIPKTDINIASLMSIFLFLKFTIIATIAVGMKNIKFVACATCCSMPIKNERRKIRIVPPPIPVPLTIPDAIPIKISITFLLFPSTKHFYPF